jgi:hypothetical protein
VVPPPTLSDPTHVYGTAGSKVISLELVEDQDSYSVYVYFCIWIRLKESNISGPGPWASQFVYEQKHLLETFLSESLASQFFGDQT